MIAYFTNCLYCGVTARLDKKIEDHWCNDYCAKAWLEKQDAQDRRDKAALLEKAVDEAWEKNR